MTTQDNVSSEAPTTPPSGAPAEPPVSTPAGTGTTDFRYGDEAPEYLRGKTPQETLDWTVKLVNEVQQLVKQPAAAQNAQPQRTMQQNDIRLPDPDMALTDPAGYQQQLANYFTYQQQATLAQAAGPVYQQLATQSREMSRNDPKSAAIWQKYGSEVDAAVANIPAHLRTKELYDKAVIQVKGERFDELAADKAATLAAAGTGLARAGSDAGDDVGADDGDVWDKIAASPIGKAALNVAGKKGIRAAIANGAYKSLEDYAAQAAKSKARVDPANPNIIRDYARK